MIIVLLLLLAKPIKSSLLSRVKNRYEYLPHEDADFGSDDLYEFVSTNDFLPEPKNIVPKLYDLNPNSFKQRKTTMHEIPYSFDKIRKTMENEEIFEEARQTIHDKITLKHRKTLEDKLNIQNVTDKLNILNKHIYDVETYVSLNNNYSTEIYLKVGSNSTAIPISLEWRPTKNMSIDTTDKRRKTFASLFPTRRNLDTITGALQSPD
ncbi:unnamed protein product [Pieris macdunnoughi]|uniref:Uncharacterized protein n=1 Tax=Pieris macdunnoughi TaxID=345717 RepID=A0A821M669_9NEOP|nr:unnamed protein product [Pieris macdunnoughi]